MSESRMSQEALIKALERMTVETGSLSCLGCGYEHGCSIHGCAVLREAAEMLERRRWISVEERLPEPEQEVLVSCKTNPNGYEYRCLSFYVPEKWLRGESGYNWDYEACDVYSEENDDYYVNEGWYESIHNWDDYNAVGIVDVVTHWMPLPEPPEGDRYEYI